MGIQSIGAEAVGKSLRWVLGWVIAFGLLKPLAVFGADVTAVPSQSTSQEFELEKMRLENQKLGLEVEKLRLQATVGAASSENEKKQKPSKTDKKEALEVFQTEYSKQAQNLAQQHQSETDLLVADFVNSELWYQGTRYGIHEWEALAGNQGWKVSTILNGRDPGGHARNLYGYRNVSLLRYEGRKRGVLILKAPIGEGDFRILTPEGLSFASSPESVRNTLKNEYFDFDAQKRSKKGIALRYVHKLKWQFDDKIEISFDKDGKMTDIRYGVLDEH